MSLFKKSDDKPSKLQDALIITKNIFFSKIFRYFLILFIVLIGFSCYYFYLDSYYFIDEVYDINGPQDPKIDDQITIRTIIPYDSKDISSFLITLSACPYVAEVHILWLNKFSSPPKPTSIKYTTAHSSFKILYVDENKSFFDQYYETESIKTNSLLYLDADTILTCDDLRFAQNVWRSSQESLVGFYPRLIDVTGNKYKYLSVSSIVKERKYNFLLNSALVVNKKHLDSLRSISNKSELLKFLGNNPQCYDYLLPLYSSITTQSPPIWVDGNPKTDSYIDLLKIPTQDLFNELYNLPKDNISHKKFSDKMKKKKYLDNDERGECLTTLATSIGKFIPLPNSYMKSMKARQVYAW